MPQEEVDRWRKENEIICQGDNIPKPVLSFDVSPFPADVLDVIRKAGFKAPTAIQSQGWPMALSGRDLIGIAATGSGKTLAFILPALIHIRAQPYLQRGDGPICLVLSPTRELALQTQEECARFGQSSGIRNTCLYGGVPKRSQINDLRNGAEIVIATPGRLLDLLEAGVTNLRRVTYLVMDEADRMLDMGFFDDVTKILDRIKNRTNLGLFSATISQEVMTVSWMYQRDEVEITVAPTEESKPDIDQYSITVPRLEKEEAMLRILRSGALERVIVFCNTKVMCQRLSDDLRRAGIRADCLHGDIKQATREKTMADFRHGKLPVLIATDVASRGIDVDDVDGVINYDVPEENEYYIHRIGRTGRARKKGISFTLLGSFPEKAKLDEIAKFAGFRIVPMIFDEYGCLVPAPEEEQPKRTR